MGSTSIVLGYRPSRFEINHIIDGLLAGTDEQPLIDRSGVSGWSRCWALYEPGNVPEQRFIALLKFDVSSQYFTYKWVEESMGPYELDCPQRLLRAVADYPPPNEFAAEWRRRAWDRHNRTRGVRQVLRQITREYPRGDRRLVIGGEVVSYQRASQSGRPRHAYRKANGSGPWGLHPEQADLEATELIREQPREVRTLIEAAA